VSNKILQRVAELEAQVAALSAENAALRAASTGGVQIDVDRLLAAVGIMIDRSGEVLRQDFAGKLAGLISPYLDSVMRRYEQLGKLQGELEKRFEAHRKSVAGSAAEMDASFVKMRKEAAKDWTAQRAKVQEDLAKAGEYARWYADALQGNAWQTSQAVASCNTAAAACQRAAENVGKLMEQTAAPLGEVTRRLDEVKAEGERVIGGAARQLTETYKGLRKPVLKRLSVAMLAAALIHLSFGAFILWRNGAAIDTNWQELTEHSERQKQDIKALLDKTLEEVKQAKIGTEIKVKMWDEMLDTLSPQQQQGIIQKYRLQVWDAEEDRLTEQMRASHAQMEANK
jgi:hypothetical protein